MIFSMKLWDFIMNGFHFLMIEIILESMINYNKFISIRQFKN